MSESVSNAKVKERIKEVIVVEGRDDTRRLEEIYDVLTIETRGSAIDETTLNEIARAQDEFGVIVFTDPDVSGNKIRQIIQSEVPGVKHAFLEREEAKPNHKGSLGVEHASDEAIKRALGAVYSVIDPNSPNAPVPKLTLKELRAFGLMGTSDAQKRRDYLTQALRIGHTNGKQLAKRLYLFQIEHSQVAQIMENYEAEEFKA
ncbi:MAG: ribonuclease M5 [Aerococcus sp.]|nr:ribonuclease M5 [Aerococcus sp.]